MESQSTTPSLSNSSLSTYEVNPVVLGGELLTTLAEIFSLRNLLEEAILLLLLMALQAATTAAAAAKTRTTGLCEL
jgi:hypothetical protein